MKYFYILLFSEDITLMLDTCSYCNKKLSNTQNLYFGYDHLCCSSICRNEVAKIINVKDPRLFNPEKWKKLSKKSSTLDLAYLSIDYENKKPYNHTPEIKKIKKTKSYKKEVSDLKINDYTNEVPYNNHINQVTYNYGINEFTYNYDINELSYDYDSSCNILFNTFTTLREYFNFRNFSPYELLKTKILLSSLNILNKLHF